MEEMYKNFQEKSDKFNYSLLTLTFASLALSFQYSPKMGNHLPWLLIISWVFFLISATAGGWRLVKEVVCARLNYIILRLESFIQERQRNLQNPAFVSALRSGNALNNETAQRMNEEGVRANLVEEQNKLKTARENMDKEGKWIHELFLIQFWSLILAIAVNGVFASVNFLYTASSSPSP